VIFVLGIRLGFNPRRVSGEDHGIVLKSEDVCLIVDHIGDVVSVDKDLIEAQPIHIPGVGADFTECAVNMPHGFFFVLSPDKILSET
jgi:chemotaxis signal transduction protein